MRCLGVSVRVGAPRDGRPSAPDLRAGLRAGLALRRVTLTEDVAHLDDDALRKVAILRIEGLTR